MESLVREGMSKSDCRYLAHTRGVCISERSLGTLGCHPVVICLLGLKAPD